MMNINVLLDSFFGLTNEDDGIRVSNVSTRYIKAVISPKPLGKSAFVSSILGSLRLAKPVAN